MRSKARWSARRAINKTIPVLERGFLPYNHEVDPLVREYSPRLYSVDQRFDEAGEHVLKAWNAGTLPQDGKLLIPIASVAA